MRQDVRAALQGKSVEEQLQFYKNFYDRVIRFDDYYSKMFMDWDGIFNTKCRLHDEAHGASFAYSDTMNLWTCWGACHASGRVTYYHYTYRKKYEPDITLLSCLKEIHALISRSPSDRNGQFKEEYKELPRPILLKTSEAFNLGGDLTVNIPDLLEGPSEEICNCQLIGSARSLSYRIASKFVTKQDKEKMYKEKI